MSLPWCLSLYEWECVRMAAGLIVSLCDSVWKCVFYFLYNKTFSVSNTDSQSKIFKLPDDGIDSFHGLTENMSHFSVLRNGFAQFSDHGEELITGFSEGI